MIVVAIDISGVQNISAGSHRHNAGQAGFRSFQ